MMRNLGKGLLIAFVVSVVWTTTSEACCWRRNRCGYTQYSCGGYSGGYTYGTGQGYYGGGGYYNQGYQGGYTQPGYYGAQPGYYGGQPGYDFGRPGYNPGGLGGPRSGLGVRPGLGFGGFGPGR